METKRLVLTPGVTQKSVTALWIGGLTGPADGYLAVKVVPEYGAVEEETYGVQGTADGWAVWKVSGGSKQKPYLVRVKGGKWVCGCKANRGGSGPECRHLKGVRHLASEGLLKRAQVQGV